MPRRHLVLTQVNPQNNTACIRHILKPRFLPSLRPSVRLLPLSPRPLLSELASSFHHCIYDPQKRQRRPQFSRPHSLSRPVCLKGFCTRGRASGSTRRGWGSETGEGLTPIKCVLWRKFPPWHRGSGLWGPLGDCAECALGLPRPQGGREGIYTKSLAGTGQGGSHCYSGGLLTECQYYDIVWVCFMFGNCNHCFCCGQPCTMLGVRLFISCKNKIQCVCVWKKKKEVILQHFRLLEAGA